MKSRRIWLLALLLACLLPIPGPAEQQYYNIAAVREQAKAGWQQSYTAHGREIRVHVIPHIPDVDAVPMVSYRIAELNPVADPNERWEYYSSGTPGSIAIEADQKSVVGTRGYVSGEAWYSGYEMDRQYIASNPLTLQQMLDLIKNTIRDSRLDPDVLYYAHPFSVKEGIYQTRMKRDPEASLLMIELCQSLRGLPLAGDSSRAYLEGPKSDQYACVPDGTSTSLILSPTQFIIFLSAIVSEHQELESDLPLAAFDQVIVSLEKEIKEGRLRHVYQMTLGYALFADKNNEIKPPVGWTAEDIFYAVPVWAVDCIYVESAKKNLRDYSKPEWTDLGIDPYNVLEYKRLLVNAQNGKLIDPTNRSVDRNHFTGFLSWDDVGGK